MQIQGQKCTAVALEVAYKGVIGHVNVGGVREQQARLIAKAGSFPEDVQQIPGTRYSSCSPDIADSHS